MINKEMMRIINSNPEMMKIINDYSDDENKKLKKLCHKIWLGKIDMYEYDDLYDVAIQCLMESVYSFNSEKANFETYLTGNIKRKFDTWMRDNRFRLKRNNLVTDEKGKIIYDENGTPTIIKNISLDAHTEDDNNLIEKLDSGINIEDECKFNFDSDEKVEKFLNSLSKIQKNILLMRMEDFPSEKIKEELGISNGEYNSAMKAIKMNKGLSMFSINKNDGGYNMEVNMEDRIIEISESENYRMDKYSMYSLLQDKKNGDMNCNYILQREPFQWSKEEANRYFCRILSNLPIPEIILCEQKKKGLTISHLIDGLQRLSYAEAFKENRIKIGSAGAERHLIQYRDYVLDDNGNRVPDEEGFPEYEMKVFDVIGKYYKDLPDELKKRFNNFNINVTKFFDCTDEQIADHIRDYNNHASMNKEQGGLLNVSADIAGHIKKISQKNSFFKNCGKFTNNNSIKGKLERVVVESIMLLFFRESWRASLDSIYKFVNENTTEQQFLKLNSQFNRLELALGDNNKDLSKELFTPTTMPMWISVFDKFTTYNIEDSRFVDFLNAYNIELKDKEINGISMADFKDQQTKKKTTIVGKIDLLIRLMNDFLHIDTTETENNIESSDNKVINDNESELKTGCDDEILSFVKENISSELTTEDVELYANCVDDCFDKYEISITSPLYKNCYVALIALMTYAANKDKDEEFEEWIQNYKDRTNFSPSQKINYTYMKRSFDDYLANRVKEEIVNA